MTEPSRKPPAHLGNLPGPLPDTVVSRPLGAARAAKAGVTRTELAGPLWKQLTRGVHGWYTINDRDPSVRLRIGAELLPDHGALGGWAALRHLGVTAMDGRTGRGGGKQRDVLLCVGHRGGIRLRPGLRLSRWSLPDEDVVEVDGVRVTTAARACVEIMCREGAEEGMVAADAACGAGVTTPGEIKRYVVEHPLRPGIAAARLASNLIDPRAASPPESRLRYVWVVEAGLPRPEVNVTLVDEEGFVAGLPDLLDDEAGFVGEYDGAQHRELLHHTADNTREEGFESLNLTVVRATSLDLWPRRVQLVERLQDGHRRGMARDRRRDAWGVRR